MEVALFSSSSSSKRKLFFLENASDGGLGIMEVQHACHVIIRTDEKNARRTSSDPPPAPRVVRRRVGVWGGATNRAVHAILFVWVVLIRSERKVLLADWLVCFERKVLLAGG
jgi:hypothetical protein